jgi:hypothetical protein
VPGGQVTAYLDVGIYGHPVYDGKAPGVKIGFYHPPDATLMPGRIKSVEDCAAGRGWGVCRRRVARHGYKVAPWVGRVLSQLALQQGTGYDIRRFAPARFAGGSGAGGLKAGGAVS